MLRENKVVYGLIFCEVVSFLMVVYILFMLVNMINVIFFFKGKKLIFFVGLYDYMWKINVCKYKK